MSANLTSDPVRSEFVPDASGKAIRVDAGQLLTIEDVRGGQVAALFLFAPSDLRRFHSPSHTRVADGRAEIGIGSWLYDNQRSPMAVLAEDTSGAHNSLLPACRGVAGNHAGLLAEARGCHENLQMALAEYGAALIAQPDPVHLFQAVNISEDGSLRRLQPRTVPGDHVAFRALQPLLAVISSCPTVRRIPAVGHGLRLSVATTSVDLDTDSRDHPRADPTRDR